MMDPPLYTFGSFRLDSSRGLLYRGTKVIRLPDTLARLLLLLIRANGEIVDKDTIAAQLWPGRDISDNYVTQQIYMLRQLLGEQAKDRGYVVMVRGRGYRFVRSVSVLPPGGYETVDPPSAENDDWLVRAPPEVLDRYYRGCILLEKQNANALKDAAEQFDAALRIDPDYVPALVGLARANALMAQYWYAPGSETFPKAKAAILHALEIDPSSAEARATLGQILLFCDWNWSEAEREIETAIGLSPKPTSVYMSAAWFYICKGSAENAVHALERALSIDPSSPVLRLCLAQMFMYAGEIRRAIDWISNILESFPDLWIARAHRAQAFILNSQPAEALQDLMLLPFDRAEDLALRLPLLGRAYAGCGDVEHAESIYQALLKTAQTEFVVGFNLATVAIGLGKAEEALEHLERALEKREPALLMLRSLPWFAPVAQRARFKAVLNAIWPA
jgi:DNA-binding winged helix-turn-helix (wHTH) protein/predicted Zn-dependent protease